MGMLYSRRKQLAGLHHLVTGVMNRRSGVVNRTDNGKLIGEFGRPRKNFGNLHSRHFGAYCFKGATNFLRGVGLGIESVDVARATHQKQKDTIVVPILGGRGPGQLGTYG